MTLPAGETDLSTLTLTGLAFLIRSTGGVGTVGIDSSLFLFGFGAVRWSDKTCLIESRSSRGGRGG